MIVGEEMRRAARIDSNHREIVRALRDVGVSVQSLAAVGQGVPDLLCAYRGMNYLLEVKDGSLPPSQRKLTEDERNWIDKWRGKVSVVESVEEALIAVGVMKGAIDGRTR